MEASLCKCCTAPPGLEASFALLHPFLAVVCDADCLPQCFLLKLLTHSFGTLIWEFGLSPFLLAAGLCLTFLGSGGKEHALALCSDRQVQSCCWVFLLCSAFFHTSHVIDTLVGIPTSVVNCRICGRIF